MAKQILKNARIEVNSVDLSDHCSQVTLESTADKVDVTSFGTANYREFLQGFKDATITGSFFQDFAAAKVDATLWPLHNAGTTFTVKVRQDSGAISATNPEYTATCVLNSYSPISGGVGEALTTDVTFDNASNAGLTRATS
jgi:hypothetical protein